jgi:hypothetical protein
VRDDQMVRGLNRDLGVTERTNSSAVPCMMSVGSLSRFRTGMSVRGAEADA